MQLRTSVKTLILVGCFLSTAIAAPQDSQGTKATAPDNTKINKRDRSKREPTADQANQNAGDRKLMQQIRKSIVGDKSLSTYAHNVKVIAENGKVTLKGPVRSEDEKRAVEAKATEVAGTGNVTNELSVKPAKPGKAKAAKTS